MKRCLHFLLWTLSIVYSISAALSFTVFPSLFFLLGNEDDEVDFTICTFLYGKTCNDAETVFQNYNALWKLHVGVNLSALLLVLGDFTTTKKTPSIDHMSESLEDALSAPLSMMHKVAKCLVMADLIGFTMYGAHMLNGVMDNKIHLVAMLLQFGFLVALISFVDIGLESDGVHARPLRVTSASLKSHQVIRGKDSTTTTRKGYSYYYLWIVALYFLLWMFINTDGEECTEVILNENDFKQSALASLNWNWWSVGCLENALLLIGTAQYGTIIQQMAVCWSMAGLQVVAMYVVYLLKPITTETIYIMTTVSFFLMMITAVLSAATTNKDRDHPIKKVA